MTGAVDPLQVAVAVARVFETLGIAHLVGGSGASGLLCVPRASLDIDFLADIDEARVDASAAALSHEIPCR